MRISVIGGEFEGVYGGLDFAVTQDHSAFCVIEPEKRLNPAWSYEEAVNAKRITRELGPDAYGADYNKRVPQYLPWIYTITTLHRYPLKYDTQELRESVQRLISSPQVQDAGGIRIAADGTSMQKAIVQSLQYGELQLRDVHDITGVAITTGGGESKGSEGFRNVSKTKLVGLAKHLLGLGRLRINPHLPHAGLLVDELRNFLPKETPAGNIVWEANTREGKHDDLILATALALWLAAQGREPVQGTPMVLDMANRV